MAPSESVRAVKNDKPESEPTRKRRKRTPHDFSFKRNTTSLEYLLSIGEKPVEEFVTSVQHFILEAAIHFKVNEIKESHWFFIENEQTVCEKVHQLLLLLKSGDSNFSSLFNIDKALLLKWIKARRVKHQIMIQKI